MIFKLIKMKLFCKKKKIMVLLNVFVVSYFSLAPVASEVNEETVCSKAMQGAFKVLNVKFITCL